MSERHDRLRYHFRPKIPDGPKLKLLKSKYEKIFRHIVDNLDWKTRDSSVDDSSTFYTLAVESMADLDAIQRWLDTFNIEWEGKSFILEYLGDLREVENDMLSLGAEAEKITKEIRQKVIKEVKKNEES